MRIISLTKTACRMISASKSLAFQVSSLLVHLSSSLTFLSSSLFSKSLDASRRYSTSVWRPFNIQLCLKVELLFLLLHSLVVALASLQGHVLLEQLLSILRHQDNLVLGVLRPLLPDCQPTFEDDRPASMSVMSALYLR